MSNPNTAPQTDDRPWYRQFWPWFIMALPAAAVVAGLSLVVTAVKNQDSVVRDDWYKDGKAINLDMAREQKAAQQSITADLHMDALTGEVRLTLHSREPIAFPDTLTLQLSHVTLAERDQTLTLRRTPGGEYLSVLKTAPQGRFDIELDGGEWRLLDEADFPREQLHLGNP